MKLSASNIALPAYDHAALLPRLAEMGLAGIEVAPSRVWADTWRGLTAAQVGDYRRAVEAAGLAVVGLHSLFFDHPELGLFKGAETRADTVAFLVHLSALCRDLGGRTLVYGSGRKRGDMALDAAMDETRAVLEQVLPEFEAHGTCLCFEPLGPKETDFLNTAAECLALADEFDHPALAVQLDAKALSDNGDGGRPTFVAAAPRLVHFHASEPGLGVVGATGLVDHAGFAASLRAVGYAGFVSIEQRMFPDTEPLEVLGRSAAALKEFYG